MIIIVEMKMKMTKAPSVNNFVAKHAREFNVAAVHVDKKKRDKSGWRKHKDENY